MVGTMPIHDIDSMVQGMNAGDAWLIRTAYTTRGVADGARLRAKKPFRKITSLREGCANYVWRMLCFDCAGFAPHNCMPVCASMEVMEGYNAEYGRVDRNDHEACELRRDNEQNMLDMLDELTKRAESALPIRSFKGILQWGKVLGI